MRHCQPLIYSFVFAVVALFCCNCSSTRDWVDSVSSITKNAAATAHSTAQPIAGVVAPSTAQLGRPVDMVAKLKSSREVPMSSPLDSAVTSSEPKEIASAGHIHHPEAPSMVGSNLLVRTTAYCHKEKDSLQYGLKNAAGGNLKYTSTVRSAAADWSRFPLGTRFKIHGQPQEYVIDDYGSALVGSNTIDLYKPTFGKMNEWGVRHVPIQIIEWGSFEESREILDGRKHVKHADHVRKMLSDINARYAIKQDADSDSKPRA